MIDILLAVILISILVVLWINHRILEFNIKDLEDRLNIYMDWENRPKPWLEKSSKE